MSLWLKRWVVTWCALALLLGGGWWFSSVQAQNEAPPPASTPEAAAANFVALLANIVDDGEMSRKFFTVALLRQSISRVQLQKIENHGSSDPKEQVGYLLMEMIALQRNRDYKSQVSEQNAGKAVVELQKIEQFAIPPIVCVAEDGGWRVDLFGTYAKWKGLSDLDRDVLVARLTGEVSPTLKESPQFAVFLRAREDARRASCQSNLKQIALGMMQYVQDYDEKLPPAREWGDVLQPYVKSQQIFRCPSVPDQNGFGYAYNSRLSGKGLDAILQPAQMVMIYETTNLGWNAYGMGEKPAFRHFDGANYAFASGHVKWSQREKIPQFTFRPSNK